jgi:hypothetical protein
VGCAAPGDTGRPRLGHTCLVPGTRVGLAALTVAVALVVCSCGPFGDPGAPVAYVATTSHSLGAIAVEMCGAERVVDISVAREVGRNVITPGSSLWELRSNDDSEASLFYIDSPPPGFTVALAAPAALTGDLVVTVRTTRQSFVEGISTSRLPVGGVYDHGHTKTLKQLPALTKSRCG